MTKFKKRLASLAMAALLVIGMIPVSGSTVEAKAEETAKVFDATALDATGVADKDPIAEGTSYADGYFKVVGTVTQRTNSDGTMKCVEVAKAGKGAIQFTTFATADVVINMSSTGGSNTSAVGLLNTADGSIVAEDTGITTVSTTAATTLKYTSLPAGTYQVISPENAEYGRGARLMNISVAELAAVAAATEYLFDATTLDATGVADKDPLAEGTTYVDGYFKIVGNVTQRTNSDGTMKCVEVAKAGKGAVAFTVTGTADVTLAMSSTGGSNTSAVGLIDADGNIVANNEGLTTVSATSATTMTYTGLPAGTYQIISPENAEYGRGARLISVTVVQTSSGSRPERAAWDSVAAPEIIGAMVDGGSINVSYKMVIGYDGADKISVDMLDAAGNVLATESAAADSTAGNVIFHPEATGEYFFKITAVREGEAEKTAASSATPFVLPLKTPACTSATSQGGGKVSVVWSPVDEAESYIISYEEQGAATGIVEAGTTSATEFVVEGLAIEAAYTFYVKAVRGVEVTEAGTIEGRATKEAQRVWSFSAFGSSTNTKDNWYEGNANDGQVTVASLNGKGKIVPNSTDGIAFYYAKMDPNVNFKLSATIHVDEWTISNGQDGFGMMVADAVGEHGDSGTFWNNYFSAVVSKVEYWYNPETDTLVTHGTGTGNKISMKLGVGSQQKIGVTAANIADGTISTNINELFDARTTTFETSQKLMPGTNVFNIVGNATNSPEGTLPEKALLTDFDFTIERNNTGYFISYADPKTGETVVHKYYDTDRSALVQIDPEAVYVGFYASRNAKITASNIVLTTSDPATDAPAEERGITKTPLVVDLISAKTSGNEEYDLTIYTNAKGKLTVTDNSGNVLVENVETVADTYTYIGTTLKKGQNIFKVNFTPDADFRFNEFEVLDTYETVNLILSIMHRTFPGKIIYVSPTVDPANTGDGSKEKPTDINTATMYAQPGQVILLQGGRYWEFLKTITVERGNDGTAENPIYLMADPEATERPVLDFEYNDGKGMTIAGDYWILDGFDITNTADTFKGLNICGSNNIVQNVNTYFNGNTGIQISRYKSTDYWNDWPANNLILNCTSYNNADHGYEDADGFAAKITVGDGNVFDGCVAYNNADDGWDLYAKIESGPIGAVVIRNCIAYNNGYLLDGTNAGNGNGFKMGGDSMAGAHQLINSVAFGNKAKGIDSNSGPDIQIKNCTSYNNGSYNVALYTNNAANTAYVVDGVISFRTENMEQGEQLKAKGTQDEGKMYGANNYYYNVDSQTSVNNAGAAADASWFTTIDTTTAWTRNADGTINMNGLFVLTDKAPADTGAVMGGQANTDYSGVVKAAKEADEAAKAEPTKAPAADDKAEAPASSNGNVAIIVVVVIAVVVVAAIVIAVVLGKKKNNKK